MSRPTSIPRRLTPPEHAAVRHILARSALADTPGRIGRLILTDDGDLTMQRLDSWRWCSGEVLLLDVLKFVLGEGRWPDVSRLDEPNQQVVREAIRYLAEGEASAQARLLRAVETS